MIWVGSYGLDAVDLFQHLRIMLRDLLYHYPAGEPGCARVRSGDFPPQCTIWPTTRIPTHARVRQFDLGACSNFTILIQVVKGKARKGVYIDN